MKFEPVTIKDIATALKLSTSTVSRALRDSYEISEETKKKVTEYAKSVNYRPNPTALRLKERRTRTIGVVASEIANSFFSQVLNGIESVAKEKGYNVIITQTFESYDKELEALHNLAQTVDGVLISVSSETGDLEHIHHFIERGMPIVFFDRVEKNVNAHTVISDNYKGAFEATKHLIDNGYKRIAFIGNKDNLSIIKERKQGYIDALQNAGLPQKDDYIKHCAHGGLLYDEVENVMNDLFSLKSKPDAILSCADKMTTACFRYLKEKNIRIPKDIAFVGFSNSDLTDLMEPALSVIRQQAQNMGTKSAELLIRQIESKRPVTVFEEIILEPQLYIRESSGKK